MVKIRQKVSAACGSRDRYKHGIRFINALIMHRPWLLYWSHKQLTSRTGRA
jgi:hypothetical protein